MSVQAIVRTSAAAAVVLTVAATGFAGAVQASPFQHNQTLGSDVIPYPEMKSNSPVAPLTTVDDRHAPDWAKGNDIVAPLTTVVDHSGLMEKGSSQYVGTGATGQDNCDALAPSDFDSSTGMCTLKNIPGSMLLNGDK
jgi:hypothetical protein